MNVNAAPNSPPTPWVQIDGQTHGATVSRPHGGSLNVTVRFKATDPDGNLTGIRPQVWDPAGHLNNNGGAFVAQTGNSGEVTWTVGLNQSGNWYFWTDATDAVIQPNHVDSGAWANGFRLHVNEAPNGGWHTLPPTLHIGTNFTARAWGRDNNGNLSQVWVDVSINGGAWTAFAYNGGGNGFDNVSDGNILTAGAIGTTYRFRFYVSDTNGANTGWVYSDTYTVANRPPTGTFTVNGSAGNSSINFGQAVTVHSSITDADGNLTVHSFWWDQGSGLTWTHPYLTWNYPPNSAGWYNLNLGANGYDASGSASTRSFDFQPVKAATFAFHNVGADPHAWVGIGASVIYLTVNKTTPSPAFANRTITPSSATYTVQASDLNASFSNPYSGAVAAPTGTVSYSIVGGGAVTAGTALNAATAYTIRASYSGDSNYNATTVDSIWTINKADQTINFAQPATQTYGTQLTLHATASSGLAVTYSVVSGPATVSFGVVTFTGTGSVTLRASQAGNGSYNAAPNVDRTFTVNPQPTTFSLSAVSFTYNGGAQGPTVLPNPSNATFSTGGTLSATNAGSYTGTATASGNFTGSNTNLGWSIVKANQSITFNQPPSQTYGTPLTLSATASSGMAVSYAIVSGPATLSGNVVNFTGVGTVTVRASQAGNTNYNAAPDVDRSFAVNKATPTVTFNNRSLGTQSPARYTVQAADLNAAATGPGGAASPTGAISYAIAPDSAAGTPGAAVTAGTVLPVATYKIRASYPGDGLYNAAAQDATWIVTDDVDGDGIPGYIEAQLGTDPNSANHQNDSSNQSQLKVHRPKP